MGAGRGTYTQVGVALKHLDGRILAGLVNIPVIDARRGDETDGGLADPLPELHILVHSARLELLLLLEVEDLEGSGLGFEGDDLAVPVHDGTVGLDRPSRNVVAILELDDDNLGLRGLVLLFSDAHVVVGFECLRELD
jgi:hypothetical protein